MPMAPGKAPDMVLTAKVAASKATSSLCFDIDEMARAADGGFRFRRTRPCRRFAAASTRRHGWAVEEDAAGASYRTPSGRVLTESPELGNVLLS